MKRSGKRRFQTLGMRMLQFSRRIIYDYIPSGDLSEVDEAAPEWSSSPDAPFQRAFEPEPIGDGPTYIPPAPETPPSAPPRPAQPPSRQQPQPARPAPPTVQRKAPVPGETKLDPRLLKILDAYRQVDAEREAIREKKKAMLSAPPADAQRSPEQPSGTRRPRRGSASFDYVETSSLKHGAEADMPAPQSPAPTHPEEPDEAGIEAPVSETPSTVEAIQRAEVVSPTETEYTQASSADQTPQNVVQPSPELTQYNDSVDDNLQDEFPEDDSDAFQRWDSPVSDSAPEAVQRAVETPAETSSPPLYTLEALEESDFDDTEVWQPPTPVESSAPQAVQRAAAPADFEDAVGEAPIPEEYGDESPEDEAPAPRSETIQRAEQPTAPPSRPTLESDSDFNEPQEWATEVYSPEVIQRAIDYAAGTVEYPEDQEWVTEYDPYGDYEQPADEESYAETVSYDHDFAEHEADSPAPRADTIQREVYDDYPTDVVSPRTASEPAAPIDFAAHTIQRTPEDDMPEYAGDPEFFTSFGAPPAPDTPPQSSQPPEMEYLDGDDPFFDQPTEKVSPSANAPVDRVQRDYQPQDHGDYGEQAADDSFPQMDLFNAMVASGMIPPSPVDGHDASPASPRIQRSRAASDADSSEIHSTPDQPRSLEDDLMGLLDAAPRAPDYSHPEIQRALPVSYAQTPTSDTDAPYTATGHIQRDTTASDSGSSAPASSEEAPPSEEDVDVDKLARDVYSVLRNRLRIERERRSKDS